MDPSPVNSVSCPVATFCAAVDDSGNALTFDGTAWTAPVAIDAGRKLVAVSCPRADFCAAVDATGNAVTFDGAVWSAPQNVNSGRALAAVSCPTATYCVAVGTGSAGADSTGELAYDGTAWSAPATIDSTHHMVSLSCPAVGVCFAVGAGAYEPVALVLGAQGWRSIAFTGSYPAAVDCAGPTRCVAVDVMGQASVYDGYSWSTPQPLDSPYTVMSGVSCPTTSFCLAVSSLGDAVTTK